MKKKKTPDVKTISVGDIIWVDGPDELIEVVHCDAATAKVRYWSHKFPKEMFTRKCRIADAWIIFKHGITLTDVRVK